MKLFYFFHFLNGGFKSKKLNISFHDKKSRIEIVKNIIKLKQYKSYLEIGTFKDDLFSNIVCEDKIGVDPVSGGNVRKTSDEFFADNTKKFDLIFIDGLHHYDQVKKDISRLLKQYANDEYILLFPFCSIKHQNKKWPYFKELISELKKYYKNKYPILLAPGPKEIEEARKLNGKVVLDKNEPVNIKTLVSLINKAKFIIANDTGPAHIASHFNKEGVVLFGNHTTAKKVSIENFNFKALSVQNLKDLNVETVLSNVKSRLN